ncbi:hypothetical protein LTR66_017026 [Elasticomyces elasticus]|nr:hypothetical protein LTR66_017026 [Elasticomyces elasticus]
MTASASTGESGDDPKIKEVTIYTDSQACLTNIAYSRNGLQQEELAKLLYRARILDDMGVDLTMRWVPGHCSVRGNVMADILCSQVSRRASDSASVLKTIIPWQPSTRPRDIQRVTVTSDVRRGLMYTINSNTGIQQCNAECLKESVDQTRKEKQTQHTDWSSDSPGSRASIEDCYSQRSKSHFEACADCTKTRTRAVDPATSRPRACEARDVIFGAKASYASKLCSYICCAGTTATEAEADWEVRVEVCTICEAERKGG